MWEMRPPCTATLSVVNAAPWKSIRTAGAPFKGKDDTLAYLNYAVGFLKLKTSPTEAIDPLLKAASYESDIKRTPSTYYFLAVAYESGPYKTLSTAY